MVDMACSKPTGLCRGHSQTIGFVKAKAKAKSQTEKEIKKLSSHHMYKPLEIVKIIFTLGGEESHNTSFKLTYGRSLMESPITVTLLSTSKRP